MQEKHKGGRPPSPNSKREFVAFRATDREMEPVRATAKKRGINQSEAIRYLLRRGLGRPKGSLTPA